MLTRVGERGKTQASAKRRCQTATALQCQGLEENLRAASLAQLEARSGRPSADERLQLQRKTPEGSSRRTKLLPAGIPELQRKTYAGYRTDHTAVRQAGRPAGAQHAYRLALDISRHGSGSSAIQAKKGFHVISVDGERGEVFSKPDGEVQRTLARGLGVEVVLERGEWAAVKWAGGRRKGWMRTADLTLQPKPDDKNVSTPWAQSQGPLYAEGDTLELDDVGQGRLNDCFLLSPLAAIANIPRGPEIIKGVLTDLGLGKYRVGFYDTDQLDDPEQEAVIVDNWFPVSDGLPRTYLYSPSGVDLGHAEFPTWSAVIEKAYAAWGESGDVSSYEDAQMMSAAVALAQVTGVVPDALRWESLAADARTLGGVERPSDLWERDAIALGEEEDSASGDEALDAVDGKAVDNISNNALFAALKAVRSNRNNVLVAESLSKGNDHETMLNPKDPADLQIREGHVYVITSVYKRAVRLWEPIDQTRTARMPMAKFKQLFNRVLTANMDVSPIVTGGD